MHLVVAQRRLVADALVGTPLGARVDLRLGGGDDGLHLEVVGTVRVLGRGLVRRRLVGRAGAAAVVGEPGRVDRRLLADGVLGLAGVDHGELHVGRCRLVGAHLDLHRVHVADQQCVRAGPCLAALLGARVRAVLVVVLRGRPARPGVARPRADLDVDGVVLDRGARRPRDAHGAVPLDRHHVAVDDPAAVGGGALVAPQRRARPRRTRLPRLRGQRVLVDLAVHGGRRHLGGRSAQRDVRRYDDRLRRAHVHRHGAGRRRQHGDHDSQRQQLLAEGHEPQPMPLLRGLGV